MLSGLPHVPASEHTILDGLAHDNPLLAGDAGEVYRRTAAPLTKATASATEEPTGDVVVADERLGGVLRSCRRSA